MGINRRKFLKSVGLGTIMLGAQPLTALASEALVSDSSSQDRKDITDDGPQVQIGDHIAIADTEYGKVKGYIMRGIYTFLGIPYAADTSGKNRFMPPCKHKPWTGVRPAVFMEIQRLKMYIVVHPLHMICSLIIGTMMRSVKIVFA